MDIDRLILTGDNMEENQVILYRTASLNHFKQIVITASDNSYHVIAFDHFNTITKQDFPNNLNGFFDAKFKLEALKSYRGGL